MINTKKWLTCSCHFQCFKYEIRFVGPPEVRYNSHMIFMKARTWQHHPEKNLNQTLLIVVGTDRASLFKTHISLGCCHHVSFLVATFRISARILVMNSWTSQSILQNMWIPADGLRLGGDWDRLFGWATGFCFSDVDCPIVVKLKVGTCR